MNRSGLGCDTTLLSYPRSGNHLVRYLIEYELGHPTLGAMDGDGRIFPRWLVDRPIYLREGNSIRIVDKVPLVTKRHDLDDLGERSKLIFILRDPIDSVLSHTRDWPTQRFCETADEQIAHWIRLLLTYRSWHKERRLLIKYPSLVASPLVQVKFISEFLKTPTLRNWDQFPVDSHEIPVKEALSALVRPADSGDSVGTYRSRMPERANHLGPLLAIALETEGINLSDYDLSLP
jgi:hypothetical protein